MRESLCELQNNNIILSKEQVELVLRIRARVLIFKLLYSCITSLIIAEQSNFARDQIVN